MGRSVATLVIGVVGLSAIGWPSAARGAFVNFESGHVRPLAIAPGGGKLFAVNTPDNRLEIYDITTGGLSLAAEVPVGLEPVAVAARVNLAGATEAWVVNHLSDSVSIVELDSQNPARSRVTRTLLVGDEPRDIVFAGSGHNRAFITCARRGQNRFPSDPAGGPQVTTPGVGRADVWAFNADNLGAALGGTALSQVQLFGDTPRALAASLDGSIVYAAILNSGNQTTTITQELVTNNGGLPQDPPNATPGKPDTGLIVKFNGSQWQDEQGRNWNSQVAFSLPDEDVFLIDADHSPPVLVSTNSPSATPTIGVNAVAGVGTTLFNMAVRPNGNVYVTNTDAKNEVRFEPMVRGHLAESRVTVISGTAATPHHLNPHINYAVVPGLQTEIDRSLAFPMDMTFSADGNTLFVVGFGSAKVGAFVANDLEGGTITESQVAVGNGPSGIVLDVARNRLYVMNRIDHTISIIGNASQPTRAVIGNPVPLRFDPSPPAARNGRIFLYDARRSGHGDSACASCHTFGDFDGLAWDLGDPFGTVVSNPNPFRVPKPGGSPVFHPMKGPMTTQSLRGMADPAGPMHWRGDRTGGSDAGGDPLAEDQAFKHFNPAFVGLLGATAQLQDDEMQAYTDFILTVKYPPNPIRALTNVATNDQSTGRTIFRNNLIDANAIQCNVCHVLDARDSMGTDGQSSFENETQEFKIAHLRNLYQKVGMFGVPPGTQAPATGFLGNQIRGFGFLHDGSIPTVFDFLNADVFNFGSNAVTKQRQVEAFILALDTGLAPIVGQQVSATSTTWTDATVIGRITSLLVPRAGAGDCDLVVKGVFNQQARGWLYQPASGLFQSDRASENPISESTLRQQAATVGQELTYTAVPPGTGTRIGLDRDEDGFFDRTELDAGSDPANAASVPGASTTTTTTSTSTSTSTSTTSPATTSTSTTSPASSSTTTTLVPTTTTLTPVSTSTTTLQPTTTTLSPVSTSTTTTVSTTTTSPGGSSTTTTTTSPASSSTTTTTSPGATTTTSSPTSSTSTTSTTTTLPTVTIRANSFRLRDRTVPTPDPSRRSIAFRSSTRADVSANRVVPDGPQSAGDPTARDGELAVYDTAGSGEIVRVPLLRGSWSIVGTIGNFAGWRFTGSDPNGPVKSIVVKRDSIVVKGGKANWPYTLNEPSQGRVALRLTLGTRTWCAEAPAKLSGRPPSTAANDHVDKFVGQPKTSPPAACPPLP